jgi:hypothetical protein
MPWHWNIAFICSRIRFPDRLPKRMAKKLHPKEIIDLKELVLSEVIQMEALVNVLESKGILTREELLEKMENIASQMRKVET